MISRSRRGGWCGARCAAEEIGSGRRIEKVCPENDSEAVFLAAGFCGCFRAFLASVCRWATWVTTSPRGGEDPPSGGFSSRKRGVSGVAAQLRLLVDSHLMEEKKNLSSYGPRIGRLSLPSDVIAVVGCGGPGTIWRELIASAMCAMHGPRVAKSRMFGRRAGMLKSLSRADGSTQGLVHVLSASHVYSFNRIEDL